MPTLFSAWLILVPIYRLPLINGAHNLLAWLAAGEPAVGDGLQQEQEALGRLGQATVSFLFARLGSKDARCIFWRTLLTHLHTINHVYQAALTVCATLVPVPVHSTHRALWSVCLHGAASREALEALCEKKVMNQT